MTQEERNWLRLHLARGLGRKGLIRLREVFGSTDAILEADPAYRAARSGLSPKLTAAIPEASDSAFLKACEALERIGARVIDLWDPDYPPLLRTIHDPPALLYLRGTLPPQASGALAVVGARLATTAGRRLTAAICSELASRGIAIVSGLARGIDTAAHQGALDGNGPTVAVLGCGIDRVYPAENARLFAQILEQGAILSEYPPGTPPLAGHFPGRNRIISGLSRGVLVVEARRRQRLADHRGVCPRTGAGRLRRSGTGLRPHQPRRQPAAERRRSARDRTAGYPGRSVAAASLGADPKAGGCPCRFAFRQRPHPLSTGREYAPAHRRSGPEKRVDTHGGFRYFTAPRAPWRGGKAPGDAFRAQREGLRNSRCRP